MPERVLARAASAGLPLREGAPPAEPDGRLTLRISLNGRAVPVPEGIGARGGGHAAVRTVDDSGTVHLDRAGTRPYTLGQLFEAWGVRLTPTCIGAYCRPRATTTYSLAGAASRGDPRRVPLRDGARIDIAISAPGA